MPKDSDDNPYKAILQSIQLNGDPRRIIKIDRQGFDQVYGQIVDLRSDYAVIMLGGDQDGFKLYLPYEDMCGVWVRSD